MAFLETLALDLPSSRQAPPLWRHAQLLHLQLDMCPGASAPPLLKVGPEAGRPTPGMQQGPKG